MPAATIGSKTVSPPSPSSAFLPRPPARRFGLARALSLRCQRGVSADHPVALGSQSIALPPLPAHRGYAGETVELSDQLDEGLRVFRAPTFRTAGPLPS